MALPSEGTVVNVTIDPMANETSGTEIIYANALDLPEFTQCIDLGGALISDSYGIHILQNDSKTFFLFDEFAGRDEKGIPLWQLLDTLAVPGTELNIGWTGNVMFEGVIDPEILVLLPDNTDWFDAERFTEIEKAWRFDRKQKSINEIPITGLVCLNDIYSID
ncbi:MAG: hypothetical protein J1E02_03840 [Coprobacter sp.]|nr:hypothetical protein [Coprobacter sp.]